MELLFSYYRPGCAASLRPGTMALALIKAGWR